MKTVQYIGHGIIVGLLITIIIALSEILKILTTFKIAHNL